MIADNKLRQVTDTIHGTIFLSRLESEMIATPYFFRLHDVYQSSTVYMTYPANRTKRYEHSLGVMQLASRMFFSSISNADDDVKQEFFAKLEKYFCDIYDAVTNNFNNPNQVKSYCESISNDINTCFENTSINEFWEDVYKARKEAKNDGIFSEQAINQFQYYSVILSNVEEPFKMIKPYFLYRCMLQALRIVGLFHDAGHPPFSHIIEDTLCKLFRDAKENKWDEKKSEDLVKVLEDFFSEDKSKSFECRSIYVNAKMTDSEPHERVGFSLLQYSLYQAIPAIVKNYKSNNVELRRVLIMYLITVAEFSMAILSDMNDFFSSMHSIVDGIIDADRLDYINRDTHNSGVNWGHVPYDRLIEPMKMILIDKYNGKELSEKLFVVAFPKKLEDDIIDVLILRYKIFSRVNFHHTSIKTATALQKVVELLAEDYLKKDGENQRIKENRITILWDALGFKAGDKALQINQWNDSYLIATLSEALVQLKGNSNEDLLKMNLEEVLLNKKQYFSIFKRGQDCKEFITKVLKYATITPEKLLNFKKNEFLRLYGDIAEESDKRGDDLQDKKSNQQDSLNRASLFYKLRDTGDLKILSLLGYDLTDQIIERELEVLKKETIIDSRIHVNAARDKLGIPDSRNPHKDVFLYDKQGEVRNLDITLSLKPQISVLENGIPWIYIYILPRENNKLTIEEVVKDVTDRLARAIANDMKKREKDLIGSSVTD